MRPRMENAGNQPPDAGGAGRRESQAFSRFWRCNARPDRFLALRMRRIAALVASARSGWTVARRHCEIMEKYWFFRLSAAVERRQGRGH